MRTQLEERIEQGRALWNRTNLDRPDVFRIVRDECDTWDEFNVELLRRSFTAPGVSTSYVGPVLPKAVLGRQDELAELGERIQGKIRWLQSLIERLPLFDEPAQPNPAATPIDADADVFIVHGHDGGAKQTVARFLARLTGRQPIILHEHPDLGRTIIEKFEDHAGTAGAAVVLLTGDDVGGAVGVAQSKRARQNVVLECGWFLGRFGRGRVVILYEPDVELPSDLHGLLYVPLDPAGAWRMLVARELKAAGLTVDLEALTFA